MMAQRFGIFIRAAEADRSPLRLPMRPRGDAALRHRRHVAGLDTFDVAVERAGADLRDHREELEHHLLVGRARHVGQGVEALRHAGKGKKAVAAMDVQRLLPERIAREQQAAPRPVPQREGVIADQARKARVVPALEGGQQDGGVANTLRRRCGNIERGGELVAIVEPDIGHQHEAAATPDERLAVEGILRQQPHQLTAECDAAIRPLAARIWPVQFLRGQHPRAPVGGGPAVEMPEAGKRRHRGPGLCEGAAALADDGSAVMNPAANGCGKVHAIAAEGQGSRRLAPMSRSSVLTRSPCLWP